MLGSNFMVGHNLFFDIERRRLGFAPSDCHFEDEYVNAKLAQIKAQGGGSSNERNKAHNRYIHLEDDALYTRTVESLSTACGARSSFLSKSCSAVCDTTITTGYTAEGVQEWGQRLCTAEGTAESSIMYTTEKCQVVCEDHAGGIVLGKAPGCRIHHWSSCSPSCEQQRYAPAYLTPGAHDEKTRSWLSSASHWIVGSITSGATSSHSERDHGEDGECRPVLSKRACQVHKCPIEAGDYAVTLVFSIVSIPFNVWTHAHRSELITALSRALTVPEHIIHAESPRLSEDGLDSLEMQARIRISESLFSDSPRDVGNRIIEMSSHKSFPNVLAHYLNGEMLSDLKWRWLTGDRILSVKKAEVKHLAETASKMKKGKRGEGGITVADPGAQDEDGVTSKKKNKHEIAKAVRIKAMKNSPSYWNINYGAFGSPLSWDQSTFKKIFVIMMIQGVSLSIFFILRRMRSIRQAQARDPTPSFDAFKGVAPKKRVSSRAGQALDRRGRNSSSRLHNI